MVTLGETIQDAVDSGKSQQKTSPVSGFSESQSNQEGNNHSVFPEKELGKSQISESSNAKFSASQSNEEGTSLSMVGEKVLDKQLRQSSDCNSRDQKSQSSQEGTPLSVIPVKVSYDLPHKQSPSTSGDHTSESNQRGASLTLIPVKLPYNLQQIHESDTGVHAPDKEGNSLSSIADKVPESLQLTQSPNAGLHALRRDQEVRTPRKPDKASGDGYNWRKYGQKLVKGNEFIRSYYRCTHPNCPAKRQVEHSQDGQITDTIYLSKHVHPKPQPSPQVAVAFVRPVQTKGPDEPPLAMGEDKSSNAPEGASHHAKPMESPRPPSVAPNDDVLKDPISQSDKMRDEVDKSGNPDLKRQKRDISNIEETLGEKPTSESRVVIQTTSNVDIVNDGYRWRKYGQKLVKGNPNPRSYYRCSNAGCPVKKHVERASHDPKVVITTYEGQHVHDMPPCRTVTPNASGPDADVTSLNEESRSRSDGNSSAGLDVVVHVSAN